MTELDRIYKALQSQEDFHKFLKKDAIKCAHHLQFEASRIYENVFRDGAVKKEVAGTVSLRSLKVSEFLASHVYGRSYNNYPKSKILLQGNWLRDKGFEIGNHVRIIALKDLIMIVPDQHNLFGGIINLKISQ